MIKLRDEYDVLVVGAGPGGSTAALMAAKRGLSVLLVEKRQEIGAPVRCAEAAGHLLLEPYIPLDQKWICAEIDAFRIFGPSGRSARVPPTDPTVVLERKIFDRELADAAARVGATVRAKTEVTGLIQEDGFVRGAVLNCIGDEVQVRAKVTIAADGAESQIGRWAGLKTSPRVNEYYTAAEYLLAGVNLDDPRECQYWVGSQFAPGGYIWVFPKGEGKANVGIVITATVEKQNCSAKDYLDAFIEKYYPEASTLSLILGGIPVGGTLKDIIGNGIMLVGDAAHQAEPVTGGGINLAMFAGHMAADVAVDAIAKGDWSRKGLEAYPKQWHKEHGRALTSMSKVRHMAIKFSDERIEKLLDIALDLPTDKLSAVDIILRVVRHDPALLWEAKSFLLPI